MVGIKVVGWGSFAIFFPLFLKEEENSFPDIQYTLFP